jgi:probable HAF family extracellular repeat protein
MNRRTFAASVFVFAVAASAAAGPPPPSSYVMNGATITELGTLGGTESWGNDINNSGTIVGAALDTNEKRRAFRFDGNMLDISIGSFTLTSSANGINNLGKVVGTYEFPSPPLLGEPPSFPKPFGFYWQPGSSLVTLDALTNDIHWQVGAGAINDSGVIVGSAHESWAVDDYDGPCSGLIPVRWQSYSATPTSIICWYGYPTAINNSGSIVGTTASGYPSMFRIVNGVNTALPQEPPLRGMSVHSFGIPEGINNQNHVVGFHYYAQQISANQIATRRRAFYWNGSAASTTLLGVLPGGRFSEAHDINQQRMAVGNSETNPNNIAYYRKAFIWHVDFGMVQLPSLPPQQQFLLPGDCYATALNDRNASADLVQATGHCMQNGKRRAVRWDITVHHVTSGIGSSQPQAP